MGALGLAARVLVPKHSDPNSWPTKTQETIASDENRERSHAAARHDRRKASSVTSIASAW